MEFYNSLTSSSHCCSFTIGSKGLFVNSMKALWLSHLVFNYLLTVMHLSLPWCWTISSNFLVCVDLIPPIFCKSLNHHFLQGHSQFFQVISREIFSSWTATLYLGLSMTHSPLRTVTISLTRQWLKWSQNPISSQLVFLDHHWHHLC